MTQSVDIYILDLIMVEQGIDLKLENLNPIHGKKIEGDAQNFAERTDKFHISNSYRPLLRHQRKT